MSDDADKNAILAVMRAETEAFLRCDFDGVARHWVQGPQVLRFVAWGGEGKVIRGWDEMAETFRAIMRSGSSEAGGFDDHIRLENVCINLGGDMAWVSYDQIGRDDSRVDGVQHEMKVFHRLDGVWKIAAVVLLRPNYQHMVAPLVEVDANSNVLWMNQAAKERLRSHLALVVSGGRLRLRRRDIAHRLHNAVIDAAGQMATPHPIRDTDQAAQALAIGEDDAGAPILAWVFHEDDRILVSFDDSQALERRLETAAQVYSLSPAQSRLARLLVEGCELTAASEQLGVSVNTLRTQLGRMFDKTGARSQAALIAALLSFAPPG